jgi:hypothetical protein
MGANYLQKTVLEGKLLSRLYRVQPSTILFCGGLGQHRIASLVLLSVYA